MGAAMIFNLLFPRVRFQIFVRSIIRHAAQITIAILDPRF